MSVAPSCRVLLVEEDEALRKDLVAILDRSGFAVTMAESVAGAIEKLGRGEFAVMIVDLDLSARDGQSLFDFIRDRRDDLNVKVVIISAADPDLRKKYDLRVAEEVLFKPVTLDYVVQRARRYC